MSPPSSPFGPAADAGAEPTVILSPAPDVPMRPVDVELTWAELAERRPKVNDGKHAFTVAVYFEQADPEVSMDDMVCGPDNMIGIGPMVCFWCGVEWPRDGSGPATVGVTWCPGKRADA